ncbi:energy transducer TonB [Acinetobacter johnsonii]|uniref:Energy transducer TonB n=1 Tax=Acinetobacter johnsonii TaxID=40214 RepID=A0AA42MSM3_ACIJO|nr:TonB-dependent receptor [Acinetobacter johnsonii]MDH0968273.1 energy transducer TonB [Acinetobacter johnsonii]
MKPLFLLALSTLPFHLSHAAQPPLELTIQKSSAQSAHLTTRIQWLDFPKPQYKNSDLNQQNRAAIIRVYADETGEVTKATVQETTGIKALDEKLVNAVLQAKVKPFMEDSTALAVIGYQVFNLNLTPDDAEACNYSFDSKNWRAQQQQQKVPFQYQVQPKLALDSTQLNNHDRQIKFSFKADKHGNIKKPKITKGSGIYELDQQVLQAVANSKVSVKRTASRLWLYKKSKFKDAIEFDLNACR